METREECPPAGIIEVLRQHRPTLGRRVKEAARRFLSARVQRAGASEENGRGSVTPKGSGTIEITTTTPTLQLPKSPDQTTAAVPSPSSTKDETMKPTTDVSNLHQGGMGEPSTSLVPTSSIQSSTMEGRLPQRLDSVRGTWRPGMTSKFARRDLPGPFNGGGRRPGAAFSSSQGNMAPAQRARQQAAKELLEFWAKHTAKTGRQMPPEVVREILRMDRRAIIGSMGGKNAAVGMSLVQRSKGRKEEAMTEDLQSGSRVGTLASGKSGPCMGGTRLLIGNTQGNKEKEQEPALGRKAGRKPRRKGGKVPEELKESLRPSRPLEGATRRMNEARLDKGRVQETVQGCKGGEGQRRNGEEVQKEVKKSVCPNTRSKEAAMMIKNTESDTARGEVTPQRQSAKGRQYFKGNFKKKGRPWKVRKKKMEKWAQRRNNAGKAVGKLPDA